MDILKVFKIALKNLDKIDEKALKSILITYIEPKNRGIPAELEIGFKRIEKSFQDRGFSPDEIRQKLMGKMEKHPKWSFTFETQGATSIPSRVTVDITTGEAEVLSFEQKDIHMSILEVLECVLNYINQELGVTDVKQVLIEDESSELLADEAWIITLLPKGLENPDISDIVRVRIDKIKRSISVVEV